MAPEESATGDPTAAPSTSNWTVPVGTGAVPIPILAFVTVTVIVTLPPPLTPHWAEVVESVVAESNGQGFAGDGAAGVTGVQFEVLLPVGVTRLHVFAKLKASILPQPVA